MQTHELIQELILDIRFNFFELRRVVPEVQSSQNTVIRISEQLERLIELTRSFFFLNPGLLTTRNPAAAITDIITTDVHGEDNADDGTADGDLRIDPGRRERSRTRIRFTDEESELIIRLRNEGISLRDIAGRVNKSVDQVRYHWRWKVQRRPPRRGETETEAMVVQMRTPDHPRMNRRVEM